MISSIRRITRLLLIISLIGTAALLLSCENGDGFIAKARIKGIATGQGVYSSHSELLLEGTLIRVLMLSKDGREMAIDNYKEVTTNSLGKYEIDIPPDTSNLILRGLFSDGLVRRLVIGFPLNSMEIAEVEPLNDESDVEFAIFREAVVILAVEPKVIHSNFSNYIKTQINGLDVMELLAMEEEERNGRFNEMAVDSITSFTGDIFYNE